MGTKIKKKCCDRSQSSRILQSPEQTQSQSTPALGGPAVGTTPSASPHTEGGTAHPETPKLSTSTLAKLSNFRRPDDDGETSQRKDVFIPQKNNGQSNRIDTKLSLNCLLGKSKNKNKVIESEPKNVVQFQSTLSGKTIGISGDFANDDDDDDYLNFDLEL